MYKNVFPTRTGPVVGTGLENRMLDSIGGENTVRSKFRTLLDGTTVMLKTRGGMPEFTSTPAPKRVKLDTGYLRTFFFKIIGASTGVVANRSGAGMSVAKTGVLTDRYSAGYNLTAAKSENQTKWRDVWRWGVFDDVEKIFLNGKPLNNSPRNFSLTGGEWFPYALSGLPGKFFLMSRRGAYLVDEAGQILDDRSLNSSYVSQPSFSEGVLVSSEMSALYQTTSTRIVGTWSKLSVHTTAPYMSVVSGTYRHFIGYYDDWYRQFITLPPRATLTYQALLDVPYMVKGWLYKVSNVVTGPNPTDVISNATYVSNLSTNAGNYPYENLVPEYNKTDSTETVLYGDSPYPLTIPYTNTVTSSSAYGGTKDELAVAHYDTTGKVTGYGAFWGSYEHFNSDVQTHYSVAFSSNLLPLYDYQRSFRATFVKDNYSVASPSGEAAPELPTLHGTTYGADGANIIREMSVGPRFNEFVVHYVYEKQSFFNVVVRECVFADLSEKIALYFEVSMRGPVVGNTPVTAPENYKEVSSYPYMYEEGRTFRVAYVLYIRGERVEYEVCPETSFPVWQGPPGTSHPFGYREPACSTSGIQADTPGTVVLPFCPVYGSQNSCPFIAYTTELEEAGGATPEIYVDFSLKPSMVSYSGALISDRVEFACPRILLECNAPFLKAAIFHDDYFRVQFANGKKGPWADSIGFSGNPKLDISRL